jgi:ribonucleoside-diphosphate reductase alpha chain
MINVTKRDGKKEPLDIEKFHQVITWACESINGVSVSEVAIKSHIQFYDKIKTTDIQETAIKAAAELITEENINYQYVAGRLVSYHLRKEVYNDYNPIPLLEHIKHVVKEGYYDAEVLKLYTEAEIDELGGFIEHDRDNLMTYAAMEQFRGKYLVKNRVTGKFYETPQMAYMLIAMTLFSKYKEQIDAPLLEA